MCIYIVSKIKEWFSITLLGILTKYLEVKLNLKSYLTAMTKIWELNPRHNIMKKSRVGERFISIKYSDISHEP